MIVNPDVSIEVDGQPMKAYLARPDSGAHPAVILLEGVYGFDDELRNITQLVASTGYVGIAIDYFHRTSPQRSSPFTPEGRQAGIEASKAIKKADVLADVAAARDWLNTQDFVARGKIATWGFGFGGSIAFVTATLPGIASAIVFYGQSIASPMPGGEAAPMEQTADLRAPLLLVYGGRDEMISDADIAKLVAALQSNGKKYELQSYPNVGHSFFRGERRSESTREASDAWERTQSFLRRTLV